MIACHVFIDEISRVRLINSSWPPPQESQTSEEELMESLRSGLTALSLYSEDSALTREFYICEALFTAPTLVIQDINLPRFKKPFRPSELFNRTPFL